MTDIDGLIERLEATHLVPVNPNRPKYGTKTRVAYNPDGPEAAAALRALKEALERIADPRNTHFAGDAQVVAARALQRGSHD